MSLNSDREKLMRLYLLGRLSEEKRSRLEGEYVANETPFEEILAVEDDLRDAYARGELSGSDRDAFEKRFLLLPDQREKLEFAKVLQRYLSQQPASSSVPRLRRGWLSWTSETPIRLRVALATAAVLAIVMLALGVHWSDRLRPRTLQTIDKSSSSTATPSSQAGPSGTPATQIITLTLTPGLVRGSDGANRVLVPTGISLIRLDLRFEGNLNDEYRTTLETAENKSVWSQDGITATRTASGLSVVVDVPANLLASGDYILNLRARAPGGRFQAVADYAFRIVKE